MLYPEREPLPVPDCTKTYATRQVHATVEIIFEKIKFDKNNFQFVFIVVVVQMAPTFIWIHLEKKAKTDRINLHRDVPNSLKKHHEYDMILNQLFS